MNKKRKEFNSYMKSISTKKQYIQIKERSLFEKILFWFEVIGFIFLALGAGVLFLGVLFNI